MVYTLLKQDLFKVLEDINMIMQHFFLPDIYQIRLSLYPGVKKTFGTLTLSLCNYAKNIPCAIKNAKICHNYAKIYQRGKRICTVTNALYLWEQIIEGIFILFF